MKNYDVLIKCYDNLKIIPYQLTHYISDLENELNLNSHLEKSIKTELKKHLNKLQNNTYALLDIIGNIINADDENEIIDLLENLKGRKCKAG